MTPVQGRLGRTSSSPTEPSGTAHYTPSALCPQSTWGLPTAPLSSAPPEPSGTTHCPSLVPCDALGNCPGFTVTQVAESTWSTHCGCFPKCLHVLVFQCRKLCLGEGLPVRPSWLESWCLPCVAAHCWQTVSSSPGLNQTLIVQLGPGKQHVYLGALGSWLPLCAPFPGAVLGTSVAIWPMVSSLGGSLAGRVMFLPELQVPYSQGSLHVS